MKHFRIFLALCAMLLVFGACDDSQQTKVNEDNKEVVATTTPDLVFYDLQGPVKSCDIENGYYLFSGCRIEFDNSGVITLVDGHDPFVVKEQIPGEPPEDEELVFEFSRDDQGQISSVVYGWTGQEYTWENGRIAPSFTGFHEDLLQKFELEYDAQGHVAKQTVYDAPDSGEEVIDWAPYRFDEFTYLDFDDHGNWTRCKVKYHDYEINLDDEDEITRKIVYY